MKIFVTTLILATTFTMFCSKGVGKETPMVKSEVPSVANPLDKLIARNVVVHTENKGGSGIILKTGLVLTCAHNVELGSKMFVFDEPAKILSIDPEHDLMLLGVKTAEFPEIVYVGKIAQDVPLVSVGNPGRHRGLISRGYLVDITPDFFFSDIHIYPGSSGSGVYTPEGLFVGMVRAIEGDNDHGFPFAVIIPANKIQKFLGIVK